MAGYTRVDTINNIADGNVINAADLDGEFDGIQAAFNSSTGHNHDGTAGEGAPILALGPVQDVTISTTVLGVKTTNTVDLGTTGLRFKDFYLAGNASISGTLGVTGNTTLGDASADTVTVNGTTTFNASPIISVTDNTNAALRITQTGTGNALLVEDSSNPDATPFVIDANGFVAAGSPTTYVTGLVAQGRIAAINNVANTGQGLQVIKYRATTSLGADIELSKSASSTVGTNALVGSTDTVGTIWFTAADGVTFIPTASIASVVDGIPGTNDMPGRLVFSTTADGASTPTERMRITSATSENILLGLTASQGTARVQSIGDSATAAYLAYASSTSQREAFKFVNGNGEIASFGMNGTSLTTTVGGSERMRIDSSGNVGIGVTPSAWNSTNYNALQIGRAGSLSGRPNANQTNVSDNVFIASGTGFTYINTAVATTYQQSAGSHLWFTAPSGTAGNAITFTQAMTLNASGDLGIGTSSPLTKLEVAGNNTGAGNNTLRLTDTATNTAANQQIGKIEFFSSDTSTPGAGVKAYIGAFALDATPDAYLAFATDATTGTPIERMRITSSGNVGIGTSSPLSPLQVEGAWQSATIKSVINVFDNQAFAVDVGAGVGMGGKIDALGALAHFALIAGRKENATSANTAGYLAFETRPNGGNLTERMRIDSSGTVTLASGSGLSISATAVTSPAATDGNVFSGTYTPTLTNTTNVAASTAYECQYMRVGNVVTVSGQVDIDPTSATTDTVLGMSLPIASALAANRQLGGTAANSTAGRYGEGVAITADLTNDRAQFLLRPTSVNNSSYGFSFTYRVL